MAHTVLNKVFSGGSIDLLRTHTSSPNRSTAAGSTLGVLDACLITGFGQVTLSSLTVDSAGIATATTATNHGYLKVHTAILIAGANQTAINGEWYITAIPSSTEVKFNAVESGLTSVTITTGTSLTMKVAPLGWSKPFVDAPSFVAVYQSINPISRRHFLRVDDLDNMLITDLGATYFRGYEYMTSASDNGIYGFPPKSVLGRGGNFRKNYQSNPGVYIPANGSDISWTLVGNSNQFYFSTSAVYGNNNKVRTTMFFGDIVSYVPGDVGATLLATDATLTSAYDTCSGVARCNTYTGLFTPRNSRRAHTVSQQRLKIWSPPTYPASDSLIGYNSSIAEPDISTNRVIIFRPILLTDENNSTSIRGELPGYAIPLNDIANLTPSYEPGEVIVFKSERFVYIPTFAYSSAYGAFLLSLDKDWNQPILT